MLSSAVAWLGCAAEGGADPVNAGSSCACDIRYNGAEERLTCGRTACVLGREFACEEQTGVRELGACAQREETGRADGGSNGGGGTHDG